MDSGLVAANTTGITAPLNAYMKRSEIELGVRTLSPALLDPQALSRYGFNPGMRPKRSQRVCVYIGQHDVPKDLYLL